MGIYVDLSFGVIGNYLTERVRVEKRATKAVAVRSPVQI
jgi:hypothetical protein